MTAPLLSVQGLSVELETRQGTRRVVDDLGFTLGAGETLALVGESGSGKSQSALAIIGLSPQRARLAGSIRFDGRELIGAGAAELERLRGDRIGFVFQDPMTALNPYLRIGDQLAEVLIAHKGMTASAAWAESARMLEAVRIAGASERMRCFPHEFSGGMRQRVLIAMALLTRPRLLIADEPTTALDVTVQAQILQLLAAMQRELGMALLLITHDLGIVETICERVLVLYAGRCMEQGRARAVLSTPRHPYTRALLRARPALHEPRRPVPIEGMPPSGNPPVSACVFAPRCAERLDRCERERPSWILEPNGGCACFLASVDYRGSCA